MSTRFAARLDGTARRARRALHASLLALSIAGFAPPARALPDLRSTRPIHGLLVYSDSRRPDLFYYGPSDLRIATDRDGQPDFHFLDARYVGNVTSRDRGLVLMRSVISFRVEMPAPSAEALAEVAKSLRTGTASPELRPLPIRRLEAALVFASVGAGGDTTEHALPGGRFEGSSGHASASGDAYWSSRVFTLTLDSLDAQVFRSAIEAGELIASLGYAFVADGVAPDEPLITISDSRTLGRALRARFAGGAAPPTQLTQLTQPTQPTQPTESAPDSMLRRVVKASALRIGIDAKRWPDLIRRVDLNDRVPPGYAALDVYCFDFRDELRPDLAEKWAEVEAQTVQGSPFKLEAVFRSGAPELYASSLRFPVAVRIDRPYRFRVIEVRRDGSSKTGSWLTATGWTQLLDVTTRANPSAAPGVRPIR